jgi:hypothetical protein
MGRSTLTVLPSEAVEAIANSPPWASTIRLTIAKPNPVPAALVVWNGFVN